MRAYLQRGFEFGLRTLQLAQGSIFDGDSTFQGEIWEWCRIISRMSEARSPWLLMYISSLSATVPIGCREKIPILHWSNLFIHTETSYTNSLTFCDQKVSVECKCAFFCKRSESVYGRSRSMSGTDPTGTCYIADVKRQAPWTQSPQGPSDSYASDNREDSEAVEARSRRSRPRGTLVSWVEAQFVFVLSGCESTGWSQSVANFLCIRKLECWKST